MVINICRLCLTEKRDPLKNIINSTLKCSELTLIDFLYWVFGVEINVCDPYSKLICLQCISIIKYVSNFRETFQRNQTLLQEKRDLFENHCLSEASTPLLFNDVDTSFEKGAGTSKKKRNTIALSKDQLETVYRPIVTIPRLEESDIYKEYRKINDTLYKKIEHIGKFNNKKKFTNIRSLTSPLRKRPNSKITSINPVNNTVVGPIDKYRHFQSLSLIIPRLEDTKFREEFDKVNDTTYKQIPRKSKANSDILKHEAKRLNFINYYYGVRTSALQELIKERNEINSSVKTIKYPEVVGDKRESVLKIGGECHVEVCNYYGNVFRTNRAVSNLKISRVQPEQHETNKIKGRKGQKKKGHRKPSAKSKTTGSLNMKETKQLSTEETSQQTLNMSFKNRCLIPSTASTMALNEFRDKWLNINELLDCNQNKQQQYPKSKCVEKIKKNNTQNPQCKEKRNQECSDPAKLISNVFCSYDEGQSIEINTIESGRNGGNNGKINFNAEDEFILQMNKRFSTCMRLNKNLTYVDSKNLENGNRDIFGKEQHKHSGQYLKMKRSYNNSHTREISTSLLFNDVEGSHENNLGTSVKNHMNCVALAKDQLDTISVPSIIDDNLYKEINTSKDDNKKLTHITKLTNPVNSNITMVRLDEPRHFPSLSVIMPRLEDTRFHEEFRKLNDTTYKYIPRKLNYDPDFMNYESNRFISIKDHYKMQTRAPLIKEKSEIQSDCKIVKRKKIIENESEPLFEIDSENKVEVCKYCSETFETKQMINSHYKVRHGEQLVKYETGIITDNKRRKTRANKRARAKRKTTNCLAMNKTKKLTTDQTINPTLNVPERDKSLIPSSVTSTIHINEIRHKWFTMNKYKRDNFLTNYENFPNLMFVKESKENNLVYHKADRDEQSTGRNKTLLPTTDNQQELSNVPQPAGDKTILDSIELKETVVQESRAEYHGELKKKINLLQSVKLSINTQSTSQMCEEGINERYCVTFLTNKQRTIGNVKLNKDLNLENNNEDKLEREHNMICNVIK